MYFNLQSSTDICQAAIDLSNSKSLNFDSGVELPQIFRIRSKSITSNTQSFRAPHGSTSWKPQIKFLSSLLSSFETVLENILPMKAPGKFAVTRGGLTDSKCVLECGEVNNLILNRSQSLRETIYSVSFTRATRNNTSVGPESPRFINRPQSNLELGR